MQHNPRRRRLLPKKIGERSSQEIWLQAFLDYIAGEAQLSENTVAAYERDMKRFFQWLDNRAIDRLTINQLADFADWLNAQKLAPATLARHIVSLRVFFRYLQLEGALHDNAAELLGSPKLWERMPSVLSPGQVAELLVAPQEDEDKLWRRDRAILEFFYATGCRVSELTTLKMRDIHADEGYCLCTGKGDKQRLVPLGRRALESYNIWMADERPSVLARRQKNRHHRGMELDNAEQENEERQFFQFRKDRRDTGYETPAPPALENGQVPWAFLSYRGKKLRREALWEMIRKYALRIGAPSNVHPHTMRHSFATHMLAGGADLRQVQEMLGHSSIKTTQIYTHVDMTRLKSIHAKFHPRG